VVLASSNSLEQQQYANGAPKVGETTGPAHCCRATSIKSTGIASREYRNGFLDPEMTTIPYRAAPTATEVLEPAYSSIAL